MQHKLVMKYKDFYARIMEAERLVGDHVFGLPPGKPLEVFYADQFEKWPENWMKGPGVFLVPVRPNKGLWFDWTANDSSNTAVLPTVKGCNPVTGLPTSGFRLERYETKCPKHNCDFLADRYCPECDYKWPAQSYICQYPCWWDGYRADDGTVRQFFFTEDELRDVATGLIGKENTVPAFGFAFYRPKEPRAVPADRVYRGCSLSNTNWGAFGQNLLCDNVVYNSSASPITDGESYTESKTSVTFSNSIDQPDMSQIYLASAASAGATPVNDSVPVKSVRCKSVSRGVSKSLENLSPVKEVSVGAGARISQTLVQDPYPLDSWKDTPDAVMTIYFVFQEKFEELKAGGFRDLEGHPEGMLANIPVG